MNKIKFGELTSINKICIEKISKIHGLLICNSKENIKSPYEIVLWILYLSKKKIT